MYYYKARIYSPALGRFMQTDPIGYEDNVNLYGYVGQDPVNGVDPTGSERVTWTLDVRAAASLGIDVEAEISFDTESLEVGVAIEGGPAIGEGASVDSGFETEESSTKGNLAAAEGAINVEGDASIRASSEAGLGVQTRGRIGVRAATDDSSGRINEAEASASFGNRQISTTGETTPPNVAHAGLSYIISATLRGEVNISIPDVRNTITGWFK